jgi:hypothetical protein
MPRVSARLRAPVTGQGTPKRVAADTEFVCHLVFGVGTGAEQGAGFLQVVGGHALGPAADPATGGDETGGGALAQHVPFESSSQHEDVSAVGDVLVPLMRVGAGWHKSNHKIVAG